MDGDLIEVDVQRTKDGELVLVHDTHLARPTDIAQVFPDRAPWKVADFTYDEMLQLDAGSWKGPEFTGEKIPTLTEAIEVIRVSRTGLLLEVKAPELYLGIEADVARTMRAVPGYLDLPSSVVHVGSPPAGERPGRRAPRSVLPDHLRRRGPAVPRECIRSRRVVTGK